MKNEIAAGLVLHLDPDELEKHGGTYSCDPSKRVQRGHFFACCKVENGVGTWMPLYSDDPRGERSLVDSSARAGHPKWTDGPCYAHAGQVWCASAEAVEKAATVGRDMSRPGKRNRIDVTKLPKL